MNNKKQIEFLDILTNHFDHFQACLRFLKNGDYDEKHYRDLRDYVLKSKRMNKKAWMFNNLAVVEYGLTIPQACKFWNSLDKAMQDKINDEIDNVLKIALEDLEVEG